MNYTIDCHLWFDLFMSCLCLGLGLGLSLRFLSFLLWINYPTLIQYTQSYNTKHQLKWKIINCHDPFCNHGSIFSLTISLFSVSSSSLESIWKNKISWFADTSNWVSGNQHEKLPTTTHIMDQFHSLCCFGYDSMWIDHFHIRCELDKYWTKISFWLWFDVNMTSIEPKCFNITRVTSHSPKLFHWFNFNTNWP